MFKIGLQRSIEEEDVYDVLTEHKSEAITQKFSKLWDDELKRKKPSILRLLYLAYGKYVISWGIIFSLLETCCRIMQPLCLGGLVSYFAPGQTDIDREQALYYALGITISTAIPSVFFHPFILYIFQFGMKMRIGCSALIYKKVNKNNYKTRKLNKATTDIIK